MAPPDMMVECVRQLLELDAARLSTTLASLSKYADTRSSEAWESGSASSELSQDPNEGVTFVLHNLPRSTLPHQMMQLLEAFGVLGACDLIYIPTRVYQRGCSTKAVAVGYGYVHFACEDAASSFNAALHCKRWEGSNTKQTIKVRRTSFSAVVEEFEKKRPTSYWASSQLRDHLELSCVGQGGLGGDVRQD